MKQMIKRVRREQAHLLASLRLAAVCLVLFASTAVTLAVTGGLGLPPYLQVLRRGRRVADWQRGRAGAVLGDPVPSPYRALPKGLAERTRTVLTDRATWRDLGWMFGQTTIGLVFGVLGPALWLAGAFGLLMPAVRAALPPEIVFQYNGLTVDGPAAAWAAVPIGVLCLAAGYLLPRFLIRAEARFARWLLAPTAEARLSARVEQLTETRAEAIDASAVELRRIERDLHDGAQARLVALSMNLGMAEDLFDSDPATARSMLTDARAGAHTAMSELRDLVRGIHPPLLADRGLPGALQALALGSPIPVDLDTRLARRLAAPVESAAYFVVAEALTNAIKHSGAERITIQVVDDGRRLRLCVRDDGRGGADPAGGTGLRGIERRLAAFDGTIRVSSPPGGPTELIAELPCGS
ncbi:sensor histidine kinase [Micromonospora eburnea]|uniref:histidine kinase n=1 Tax=Micromonospora eburnea TaxID=227316 RepID=A0A1C6UYQ3_9ACTN|nr:sensor histidine kinase [Micromonospora eburnea]SCL59188.1 Signal transduction histidine kinase [Micromonospora eburnea]